MLQSYWPPDYGLLWVHCLQTKHILQYKRCPPNIIYHFCVSTSSLVRLHNVSSTQAHPPHYYMNFSLVGLLIQLKTQSQEAKKMMTQENGPRVKLLTVISNTPGFREVNFLKDWTLLKCVKVCVVHLLMVSCLVS